MTNQQGTPEALRLADALECRTTSWPDKVFAAAELRRLHYENERLAALVEAQQPTTHVQNPAEIEHVAGDVSKNGAESDMAQQPAQSAACPVDNNFDHQTAADVLNGKTVSDEAMRKFVAVARWAHDDRVGLRATLLSVRGELASREAEIALLKKALMDAEAPQPSPTPPADSQPAPEYVGNGMFKGETIEKAAENWANWCDVRCMTGLSEFLRVVAARVQADSQPAMTPETVYAAIAHGDQDHRAWLLSALRAVWCGEAVPPVASPIADAAADSVREDAARWQWLADYLIGERTDLDEGIVACATIDALQQFVDAARKQGANHDR